MRPETNGVGVLDMASFGPYKIYDADLWKCPKCGKKVIGGFGIGALAHHNDDIFQPLVDAYQERDKLYKNYEYIKEGTDAN